MPFFGFPIWKKAPFIRLLLPLIVGIIIQQYFQVAIQLWWFTSAFSLVAFTLLFFIPLFARFRFSWLNGIVINTIFISMAGLLTWFNDIRHSSQWIGHHYKNNNALIVSIEEPPVEKINSYKTLARVNILHDGKQFVAVKGNIILYFQKDSTTRKLTYGSRIIFKKPLQLIKNPGNPGGFDYQQYCLFQGISHQVNLKAGEFELLPGKRTVWLKRILFYIREKVLKVIRSFIIRDKEQGLAEALLIGYKDDLDKTLVQSYSNTGVVHIIAISGLHIGLIYWLIILLLRPLQKIKRINWLRPLIIIAALWLFSLLAGGQPSVLRSAVMFTCIVIGDSLARKSSIFNTLALSAFMLLCYNPYWLWDVGFQLSYIAVLSLVIFMQPIYNWFYIKNKTLDLIWKLNAVTIAAQILTVPLCLYYFHQFPNLFLLTNFVAVPLSSIIVLGEILLCAISFIPIAGSITGNVLCWLIWLMNSYIERIDSLSFSTWNNIEISVLQTILLLVAVTGFSYWLMEKKKAGMAVGAFALLVFTALRSSSFYIAKHQKKIIIYNVPKSTAIDIIDGRSYYFLADTAIFKNDFLVNFHLKPARILNRVKRAYKIDGLFKAGNYIQLGSKKIIMMEKTISYKIADEKFPVDLVVISKNPKLYIAQLLKTFTINQIAFDASTPAWKVQLWKKDCDSLHIPYHDIKEKGAFVMSLR